VGIIEYGRLLACGGVQELLASVRGRPVILFRVTGPLEPAADLLAGCPEAAEVALREGEIAVTLAPGITDHAPLAARLVAAGHGLVGIREAEVNLETAFLELTRGGLAKPADDSTA
jgi:ABC-2 type transport system ATP-binding protein